MGNSAIEPINDIITSIETKSLFCIEFSNLFNELALIKILEAYYSNDIIAKNLNNNDIIVIDPVSKTYRVDNTQLIIPIVKYTSNTYKNIIFSTDINGNSHVTVDRNLKRNSKRKTINMKEFLNTIRLNKDQPKLLKKYKFVTVSNHGLLVCKSNRDVIIVDLSSMILIEQFNANNVINYHPSDWIQLWDFKTYKYGMLYILNNPVIKYKCIVYERFVPLPSRVITNDNYILENRKFNKLHIYDYVNDTISIMDIDKSITLGFYNS